MNRSALPLAILFALTLSACATAPKEEVATVAEPAPVVEQMAEVEPALAPEVVSEPAPQAEAAKPIVKKKKKRKVVKAIPKPVEPAPAPVMEPEPAPAPVVAPVYEAPAPVVVAAPVTKVQEAGFLEQYWIWLLGLVIAVAAVLLLVRKKD